MESNNEILLSVCKDIPNHESFIKIEAINKGLSGDEKYYVETAQGQRYLLRISNIESYERKKTMYDMMGRVASLGVYMSVPVDFGICNNGKNVYQLLSWCDGETADIVLPKLSHDEQYMLGVKSGQNLRRIHSIPAPSGLEDWYYRFVRINDGRLRTFFSCGVHIDGSDAILAFYEENRHLLRGRPQCFIHGDYHNDNLLISANRDIMVVDWDLIDSLYGDPWSEFSRILNANLVPHFTTGQIHGYFDGEPPEEFWRILALYLSTGALMLVSWAVYVEPSCLDECKQTASNIMNWFDGMRSPVPKWYLRELTS
ncbi:MAG: aminoglycoside phosphotransferase family protein [Lutispora sp.]|jgi:serine/threonine-protein kinase